MLDDFVVWLLVFAAAVFIVLVFVFADEKPKWKKQMDDPKLWEKQLTEAQKAVAEAEGHLGRLIPKPPATPT